MIRAAAAGAAAIVPFATATVTPVTEQFFGYPYHPGPVYIAMIAVFMVRVIIFLQARRMG